MAGELLYSLADFYRDAEPMMHGVALAADVVKKAFGPTGEMVEIQPSVGQSHHTKRGDLIMRAFSPAGQVEARGANLLKLAAVQPMGGFGDGSITTAILGEFILQNGEQVIGAGADPFEVQTGIALAVDAVTRHLEEHSQRVLDPAQIVSVGAVAADNDWELGTAIGRMIVAGADPSKIRVIAEDALGLETRDFYRLCVGPTPGVDRDERVRRAQTALASVSDACTKGVVAGGGAALLHAAEALNGLTTLTKDRRLGVDIVRRALQEPARQLAINAGAEPDGVARAIAERADARFGYDVITGDVVDMYDARIVDPLTVVRSAITRAGSVACGFLQAPHALGAGAGQVRTYLHSYPGFDAVFPQMAAFVNMDYSLPPAPSPRATLPAGVPTADAAAREKSPESVGTPVPPPGRASEPDPAPSRYIVGSFPEHVRKELVTELTVRVSYTAVPGHSGKLDLQIPPEGVTLDIEVAARAFQFLGPPQASLFVPAADESSLVGFRLKALAEGDTQIHIAAFHRGTKVGDLTLPVTVDAAADQEPTPRSGISEVKSVAYKEGDVSLTIEYNKQSGSYEIGWYDEEGYQNKARTEKGFTELSEFVKKTARTIEEIVRLDYSTDLEAAKRRLKTQGILLWQLLPVEIRDRFIDRRDRIRRIRIHSDDNPFPWEMFHPFRESPRFDSGKFLVEQVDVCRWRFCGLPPANIQLSRADFVVGDPAQLAKVDSEIAKVTSLLRQWSRAFQDRRIVAASELYELFQRAVVSLLHFTCHQSFDGEIERIMINNSPVSPEDFIDFHLDEKTATFIFMNACRSDQKVPGYTKMGGWANCFLGVGVGAFIGTLWEVRDETAEIFAEALYKGLFVDRRSFGEALNCAREAVKEQAPGDPTWLAYSFYGDTDARVLKLES